VRAGFPIEDLQAHLRQREAEGLSWGDRGTYAAEIVEPDWPRQTGRGGAVAFFAGSANSGERKSAAILFRGGQSLIKHR
jgi:hypothetical protein